MGPPPERKSALEAVLALLSEHGAGQPWWLGYVNTGADDIVFPDVPKVTLYSGWHHVLVEAGPEQAATWRVAVTHQITGRSDSLRAQAGSLCEQVPVVFPSGAALGPEPDPAEVAAAVARAREQVGRWR